MIKFKSLTIQNFLSFGNVPTIVILDRPGTTLVLGEDLDNTSTGTGANGVGKTTILNALAYSIYDKAISDISKDNLVNNINKKNMLVVIDFEVDGTEYKIERARKMKSGAAGNWVHLYKDGKDITPDSVSHTNEKIEKVVGIPYDLFVRIVAFSANHIPFLDLPVRSHYAANQTAIIEELFDLKTLSEKAELLKEQIKSTELSLDTQLQKVILIEQEHGRHEKQLESAQRRVINWENKNDNEIQDIEQMLVKVEDIDVDGQKLLYDESDITQTNITFEERTQKKLEREIKDHANIIIKRNKELVHLHDAKCPYCEQQFADTADKIEESEGDIENAENELLQLDAQLGNNIIALKSYEDQLNKIISMITVSDLDELMDISGKKDSYAINLEKLKEQNNPFIEPLDELESIKLEDINRDSINDVREKIDHQKFLLKLLTKKDSFVRKALLNKNIPFLNKKLSGYLKDLGLTHIVEFTHEMTASISQFGRPLDFGNLSNGQRARVNIALSFAFRDVLQSMHGSVNVCMLDEVLDVGLDAIGIQAAAKMLKQKSRDEKISIYIISHKSEINSAFDHKLTVQLSKGFSYLEFED